MSRESLIVGIGTALIGAAALWNRNWLLAETPKGRTLVEAFGVAKARTILAAVGLVLIGFGVLLAGGWLAPLRW
jgi:hypothetical protein